AKPEEGVLSFLAKTENSGEQQPVQGLKSLALTEEKEPFEVSLSIPGVGQDNIADPSSVGSVGSDSKTTSDSEMLEGFSADGLSNKDGTITAVVGTSDSSTDSSSITSTTSTDNVGSDSSKDSDDSSYDDGSDSKDS
ncbi:MAG: hypothetical protein ACJ72S_16390, partial [Nitrososphaeraceae archaeon]